jgi:repressor LexA
MSPVTLYKRQRQVLNFISQYVQKTNTSPTLQEIADAMGLSSLATVHEHLSALEKKGLIKRYEGSVRGIEVASDFVDTALQGIELPLVGFIAAGEPIEAIENPLETVMVSADLVTKSKRCYVLQVKGDSMIEQGIFDGDYVVIQQQNTAKDGDIVVALIDNGFATLKTFYREKEGQVRLQPANSAMDPIYVDANDLEIQGKVTGVVRKYLNS